VTAFEHKDIFLGPPGTGKTTTLLKEVEKELHSGTPPERIAYVSFTRKAAMEAVYRATDKFGYPASAFPFFRTLHSIAFRTMGFDKSDVFDHIKLPDFGKWAGIKVTGKVNLEEGSTFGNEEGDRCLFLINLARLKRMDLRQAYLEHYDDIPWKTVEYVASAVDKYKSANFLVDYTDMLGRYVEEGPVLDLEVVIIDEAQDLSPLQWEVARKLCLQARRVIVAGDDDQAIYQWAGADVKYFIGLLGNRTVLNQSWRIPALVHDISDKIAARIQKRTPKEWRSRDATGVVERVNKLAQIDWTGDDILVLGRNVKYLDEVAKWLRATGFNYVFRGYPALADELRTSIKSWQLLRAGEPVDVADVRRVYGYMIAGQQYAKGFRQLPGFADDDKVTIRELQERGGLRTESAWYAAMPKIPKRDSDFIRSASRQGERLDREPRIKLSTIHSSKGGEGEHVVLIPDMAGRTSADAEKDMDAEHRVWYVGVTRTKEKLTIMNPVYKNYYPI